MYFSRVEKRKQSNPNKCLCGRSVKQDFRSALYRVKLEEKRMIELTKGRGRLEKSV